MISKDNHGVEGKDGTLAKCLIIYNLIKNMSTIAKLYSTQMHWNFSWSKSIHGNEPNSKLTISKVDLKIKFIKANNVQWV